MAVQPPRPYSLFSGTRLRRQNFNLAPTQYRQLRRLEIPRRGSWNTLCRGDDLAFFPLRRFSPPRHLFIFVVRMQCRSVDSTLLLLHAASFSLVPSARLANAK